jgi:hypothetical protein
MLEEHKITREGCWVWPGAQVANGYGTVQFAKKAYLLHRLSFETFRGPIPIGSCVLHRCDNRLCYNPKHLFIGSKADNNADRDKKGRTARGENIASKIRGELNVHAKLTTKDVLSIRTRVAAGAKQTKVAELFGVDPSHISNIVLRKNWHHI